MFGYFVIFIIFKENTSTFHLKEWSFFSNGNAFTKFLIYNA